MTFKLSNRSLSRLEGVHPDLVKVVKEAIQHTEVDFGVTEGIRTKERQKELYESGKSKTMNSRHITGHAVDLVAWVDGGISWARAPYKKIAEAMFESAKELDVNISWGGGWESFYDGPHFQLDWKDYP